MKLKCPKCGGSRINQFRTIVGSIWCEDCNFGVSHKEDFNPFLVEDQLREDNTPGDLKPCPCCGAEVEHESTVTQETIRCTFCPLQMHYDGSFATLLEMWNRRS